jgi:hypothetical protein
MKYWKIILAILVVLVLALVLFFVLSQKPSAKPATSIPNPFADVTSNTSETPDAYTSAFYSWYLQVLAKDQTFSSSPDFKSQIGQWLTPELVANWNSIVENTDENPVLLSQDIADSWVTNVNASVVNQSATDATVLVSLGTSTDLHQLIVRLVRSNDKWSIASVDPASN